MEAFRGLMGAGPASEALSVRMDFTHFTSLKCPQTRRQSASSSRFTAASSFWEVFFFPTVLPPFQSTCATATAAKVSLAHL